MNFFWILICGYVFCASGLLSRSLRVTTKSFQSTILSASHHKFHLRRLHALKFDPDDFIKINVNKPLGLDLEEVDDGTFRGVYIADFVKDGNAERELRKELMAPKGLFLVEANKFNLRNADFDTAMEAIKSGPDLIELVFVDPNSVLNGAALLDVISPGGESTEVRCIKGRLLRSVLLEAKVDLYTATGKINNCGGGGLCGTCVVRLDVPENDWARMPQFEKNKLQSKGFIGDGLRLSCNVVVEGDAKVQVQPKVL